MDKPLHCLNNGGKAAEGGRIDRTMSQVPVAHRRLYMHSAHPRIGVSRRLTIFRPSPTEEQSAFPAFEDEHPLAVTLISGELSGSTASVLLGIQRILQGRLHAECRCSFLDIAEGLSELEGIAPSDCTVLLYQGITILQDRSDWDAELLSDGGSLGDGGLFGKGILGALAGHSEIAVVPGDRGHAVLRGVGPFVSQSGMPANCRVPADGVKLLLGQEGEASAPVAWAMEIDGRRQFHTSLGCADDFRQTSFCRMLANAVAWVAGT